MSLVQYLKDKIFFLSLNFLIFICVAFFILYSNINLKIVVFIFIIWFFPIISYMSIDYIKNNKYFNDIYSLLENLDKKYLLPELLEDTEFLNGKILNDILKTVNRDMHEHIKVYEIKNQEYQEYVEMWVHEIKTPISSSKLIIKNNTNEITQKIDMQLNTIENFVEQVLYYSKSDNLEKDYLIKNINLDIVVKNIIKKNAKELILNKIKIETDCEDSFVYTDSKWLEFILNQIVINSIKYKKEENSYIKFYTKKDKDNIILFIEDNGIGIEDKDIDKVFEKGFTGENGRKYSKSTGMGLYICKKLCDKLGLKISLKSKKNEGVVVTIKFNILDYYYYR